MDPASGLDVEAGKPAFVRRSSSRASSGSIHGSPAPPIGSPVRRSPSPSPSGLGGGAPKKTPRGHARQGWSVSMMKNVKGRFMGLVHALWIVALVGTLLLSVYGIGEMLLDADLPDAADSHGAGAHSLGTWSREHMGDINVRITRRSQVFHRGGEEGGDSVPEDNLVTAADAIQDPKWCSVDTHLSREGGVPSYTEHYDTMGALRASEAGRLQNRESGDGAAVFLYWTACIQRSARNEYVNVNAKVMGYNENEELPVQVYISDDNQRAEQSKHKWASDATNEVTGLVTSFTAGYQSSTVTKDRAVALTSKEMVKLYIAVGANVSDIPDGGLPFQLDLTLQHRGTS
mmetsp:Transcript_44226/g.138876  ORF Transcript_44226/g.138876 Transcript_44226/m.138876 type:complete len:345 (-) Transcript_44226:33-1067(-)